MNVAVRHGVALGLAPGWTPTFPSVPVGSVADDLGISIRRPMRAAPGLACPMKRAPAVPPRTNVVLVTGCALFIPTASCRPA